MLALAAGYRFRYSPRYTYVGILVPCMMDVAQTLTSLHHKKAAGSRKDPVKVSKWWPKAQNAHLLRIRLRSYTRNVGVGVPHKS